MNIIKLTDKKMPEIRPDGTIDNLAVFFNTKLKGKYAYWVQMRYIIPFEDMNYQGYVNCEENDDRLKRYTYIDIYKHVDCDNKSLLTYIDSDETDRVNSINDFILKNQYTPDADITLDELKKFRTWLASTLLQMDISPKFEYMHILFDDTDIKMLEYYAQGMYDDTIESLTDFAVNANILSTEPVIKKSCGCCGHGDTLVSFAEVSTCDPIAMYRRGIYNHMVKRFSDITFWTRYNIDFLKEMKHYIDNIIKLNFPLTKSQYISDFVDCGCDVSDLQNIEMQKLKALSISLEYIIDGDQAGHKNYINDAFFNWAKDLYEMMEW